MALCTSGSVCLLKNNPPGLEDLWFLLCLCMELAVWCLPRWLWGQEELEAPMGARLSSCSWKIPSVVAFPGHLRALLAAPCAGTRAVPTGCSPGLWNALQVAAGLVGESWPALSCPQPVLSPSLGLTCTTRMCALLHHSMVTSCSKACKGTGSDLKMESYPIYCHHTRADVRGAWCCMRKATGTVAREDDKLPSMTTSFAMAQEAELSCSCPGLNPHGHMRPCWAVVTIRPW